MRWITRYVITVVVGLIGALGCSTRASSQQPATLNQVFAIDGGVEQPSVSPDGRWVVFRRRNSTNAGTRLWLGSTGGGKPWAITSEGFDDVTPRWAPSGSRIVFTSTRPNRNGGSARYAMVLDVDPATGKPVGTPRQVSLEPVEGAAISFDGRWIAYTQRDTALRVKVVPSSGGSARLVAELTGIHAPTGFLGLTFDKAGAYIYLTTWRRVDTKGRLWRMPFKGGQPETIVQADHPVIILPSDPRYVIHWEMAHYYSVAGPGFARLKTVDGKEVGRVAIPIYMAANLNGADPWGFAAQIIDAPGEVRVVSLIDGTTKTLAAENQWPEAWMPDGSAVITDRPNMEKGGFIIETLPLSGGEGRRVAIEGEIESGGWANDVGPYYSFRVRGPDQQAKSGPTKLFSLDVRNGERRLLAEAALQVPISAPGGHGNDGGRWLFAEIAGDQLLLRSVDPGNGAVRTVRSFDKAITEKGSLRFAVHGSRVASATAQGDSVRLVLNEVDAPARTLATFPFKGQRPVINSLTWSRGGAEIAVSISSEGSPAGLSVFAIPSDRSKPVTRRDLHVSHSYCCDGIQWLPDDNAVLAIAGGSGDDAALVLFPLRNGEPPRVIAADVTSWESILSPDGKHAVYQRTRTATSTIWSASFKGLVTP